MPHSTEPSGQTPSPPLSIFKSISHPLTKEVARDVDGFYLEHWNFDSDKAKAKFVAAAFSCVTCLYFPKARDDRIRYVCSLITILFLVDDELESMSLKDGEAYNESLMRLCTGSVLPDRTVPREWIMFDPWEFMRACDRTLADEILQPVFTFIRAQTSKERLSIEGLDHYLEYRQGNVGQALLAALTRFSMGLKLSKVELTSVTDIEKNVGRHISIVNDIYSYEKELRTAESAHKEGGKLCNAVQIIGTEVGLGVEPSKRVLWSICREWEHVHEELMLARKAEGWSIDLASYLDGLEHHMSGNETWSKSTRRYHDVKV